MIRKHLARIALGCTLATAMNVAFAQSVTNGSFETVSQAFNASGFVTVTAGGTAITGWSVANDNLTVLNNVNAFDVIAPFGQNSIDLTGVSDNLPGAKLQQSVTGFAIGSTYRLSFWLGLNAVGCGSIGNICGGPNGAIVSIGSTTQTFTHSTGTALPGRLTFPLNNQAGALIANRIWDPFSLDFTATAASMLLSFETQAGVPGQNVYSGLDNVAIAGLPGTTVVPLPAAAWLLLSGLGLLGALQRRRS